MTNYKYPEFIEFMLNGLDLYKTTSTYDEVSHIIKMLKSLDYDGKKSGHDTANYIYGIYMHIADAELNQFDCGEWQ